MSNNSPQKFTYPFCYTPHPLVVEASHRLVCIIDSSPALHSAFSEGKMLGILMVRAGTSLPGRNSPSLVHDLKDGIGFLYGFSGLAGGKSIIEGFVPPIFDTTSVNLESGSAEESRKLQEWLFDQYKVSNAVGGNATVREIFAEQGLVPPGGTGDCAAPKLLQFAYQHCLEPLAMGEFWYGASPAKEVRRHGCFYPSCTGKCGPLLGYMLQGLDVEPNPLESDLLWSLEDPVIHYEDTDIVVVDKPAGMLAVPGRTSRRSLQEWLTDYCGCPTLACHRLDMDTSGLMVFAKNAVSQAALQRQFEERTIQKRYLARLCADDGGRHFQGEAGSNTGQSADVGAKGTIKLPLMLDYYDRPRQMVDFEHGRMAVTQYEILRRLEDGTLEVLFTPLTGRTHQLRVHAAHPLGLNRPICGDRLYGGGVIGSNSGGNSGGNSGSSSGGVIGSRLMLHAATLVFRHPTTFGRMAFHSGFDRNDS